MSAWPSVRLGEVIRHRKGAITIDDATTYKLCRVQLHRRGVVLREHRTGAEIRTKKQQVCRAGDFLVAEMDAKVGGYGFVPPELDGAIVSSHYFLFELDETRLWPGFLEVIAQAEILQRQIVAKGSTNYAAIRPASVLGWEIPLPPLAVQKRMATNFVHARAALASAEREIAHQDDLVAKLKLAILKEAITGRLTAGWRAANPKVEPASQLLARIRAEKARLVAAKKLRPEKPLPPIPDDETPFNIPEGWEWCRFGDVLEHTFYGPRFGKDEYVDDGIPTIRTTDMSGGSLDLLPNVPRVKLNDAKKVRLYELRENDILITRTGSIGVMALFPGGYQAFPSAYLIRCRLMEDSLGSYIFKVLQAPLGQDHLGLNTKTGTRPNINSDSIISIPIPLPPLAEQTEIVARVEALMERCRELEAEIARSRAHAEALLQAVLREAFAPAAAAC